MTVEHKTTPFSHQHDELEATWEEEARGLWWEMGCGKTKPTIDTAARLFDAGRIGGMLVLAPQGVHHNWVAEELPTHMPDSVAARMRVFEWEVPKSRTQRHKRAWTEAQMHDGLLVLVMTYSAMMTEAGRLAAWAILKNRRCLYVIDESQYIKAPNSKRTKRVLASSRYAPFRRALSGTPADDSPFDVYTQVKFLDPAAWVPLGISNATVFRSYFGVWEKRMLDADRSFDALVTYRNLSQMADVVARYGSRLTKEETLDLPPKLYTRRYFDMYSEQARVYRELKQDYVAWLDEAGDTVTAEMAITRMLRLQQVVCGYAPKDTDQDLVLLGDQNPRLELLREVLDEVRGQALIFAKFTKDVDLILETIADMGCGEAVRYDGQVRPRDRNEGVRRFQAGEARWLVGNPAAVGVGLTLHAANTVVYYNNGFKLTHRLQSEDRAHRIGQEDPVLYVDLEARGTVDGHIIRMLRAKRRFTAEVVRDELRDWL